MSEVSLGLDVEASRATAKVLNQFLADEFVLLVKTINCHWNITAPDFRSVHLLLDEQYKALVETCDRIAERVRALDERATGSMAGFHENTRLRELKLAGVERASRSTGLGGDDLCADCGS